MGLANDDGALWEFPSDHDGSAKAALVAIDRSRGAWSALVAAPARIRPNEAARLLDDLRWLEAEVERIFPNARQFVRPGFNEPELLAELEARERDGRGLVPEAARRGD